MDLPLVILCCKALPKYIFPPKKEINASFPDDCANKLETRIQANGNVNYAGCSCVTFGRFDQIPNKI